MFFASSLSIAAPYFSSADLCLAGSDSSHTSSWNSLPANVASACFWWQTIAAAASLPSSRPTVSAHFSFSLPVSPAGSSVPASSPVGSMLALPSQ